MDPLYSIPPTMSADIVQDYRMDPGEEYLTYAAVRIPYITPGLAVAAYQISRVDWSEYL
jgi:hypothetical protein